jgi:hypothetical protein
MRSLSFISFIFVAGLVLSGCNRKKDPEEQRLSWSTESPLSIPYRVRLQRLEKKNLLRNPSFETGRTFRLDSTKTSFVIDAWQQVGQHVAWVDTRQDSIFLKNEAFSGFRSVKITRNQAYETDIQGEGIMSEFIKVIPGNYHLSFYTRLENILPVKGRLGIKMFDAIEVRLLFFDKSKILLGSEHAFPQAKQQIDNSFKSLSLANFSAIPSFGWGRIIGKSAEFPFPEGDIPTNAHYVKILIGLKGTGTMWIDSIDFSYTRKNFSVGERMAEYTDTAFQLPPIILPTPKLIQRLESFNLASLGDHHVPLIILIPVDADNLTRHAAELLKTSLMKSLGHTGVAGKMDAGIRIVETLNENQAGDKGLTFILGQTDHFKSYRKSLPDAEIKDHSQGYYICTLPDLPRVIFLNGNNPAGIFYAVLSAVQLIDGQKPVFHNARVIDYPDFENRFCTLGNAPDPDTWEKEMKMIQELEACKMNGAFYYINDKQDHAPGSFIHSFGTGLNHSGLFSLAAVYSDRLDENGQSSVMVYAPQRLLPDDSSLCYPFPVSLLSSEELEKQVVALNSFTPDPPSSRSGLLLMHPVYNNQLLDFSQYANQSEGGFRGFVWLYSGSSFFSLNTDDADLARFSAFARGKPVFMDNSMLVSTSWGHYGGASPYYSGKIRLFNIFEPFGNLGIREQYVQLNNSLFWINLTANSEIDLIRLSTAADFMWNCKTYDPDYSLWKVLCVRYGADAARSLIQYADQYSLMLEIVQMLEQKETLPRSMKNVRADLTLLASGSGKLGPILGSDHPLLQEINRLNAQIRNRIEKFLQTAKEESMNNTFLLN